MASEFSRILSLLRQERGVSQRTAASDLGISQALLSHYENGIREPGLAFVVKACDYYHVSADFILGRTISRDGTMRIMEGSVRIGQEVRMMASGAEYEVVDCGHLLPLGLEPCGELKAGEVGYFTASIKTVGDTRVGDTVTEAENPADEPLPGYRPVQPMVYCGIYTEDGSKYPDLRDALEKLRLNDASLSFEPESSAALGFGFRCGFLGMLSNGPGDPAENLFQIEQIGKLLGNVPLFGICLGHQLTALAAGGKTFKLKYGHRGVNQPVRDLSGLRTYITSQNHGYAVDSDTVRVGRISFANANDGTCEGIDYPGLRAFTVQFHPEACGGPKDTSFLFDRFTALMGGDR